MLTTFLLLVLAGAQASAGPDAVHAEGAAKGTGPQARAEAIENARNAAVFNYLEEVTGSEDLSALAPVLARAATYVEGYRLKDHRVYGNTTLVEIEAVIAAQRLGLDAARVLLPTAASDMRVALLIGQELPGAPDPAVCTEKGAFGALSDELALWGLDAAEPDTYAAAAAPMELLDTLKADDAVVAAFARRLGVNVVIAGTFAGREREKPGEETRNFVEVAIEAELRAIRAADGRLLAELESATQLYSLTAAEGAQQGIQDLAGQMARPLAQVIALGTLGAPRGHDLLITLTGERPKGSLDRVVRGMEAHFGGIEASVLEETPDYAIISLPGPVTAEEAGAYLEDTAYDGFRLRTQRLVGGDAILEVRPAPPAQPAVDAEP